MAYTLCPGVSLHQWLNVMVVRPVLLVTSYGELILSSNTRTCLWQH